MIEIPGQEYEEPEGQSPLHGYRGEFGDESGPEFPLGLSIAISREAGARGTTIAQRAGSKLGWQVYTQELLEYIAQEGTFRQEVADRLSPDAQFWVDRKMEELAQAQKMSSHPSVQEMARMILGLGAQGEVILLGRGAGYLLPRETTLHVRLAAPLADRIAYMSQWLRLTEEEAAEVVRQRDQRRGEFIATHYHCRPGDVYHYDMVLNSSLLGEELCADLIVQAARGKLAHLGKQRFSNVEGQSPSP